MTSTGMSLVGVNLSGAEFGGTTGKYGYNYIYPSHSEIDYYASKNLNVIRLPFHWERLQTTLGGALDPAELARIKDVVAYAASKGMNVILDPHNFGGYNGNLIGSSAVPNSAFADFWGKLSAEFKGSSNVIFGLMNEPHTQTAATWLQSANAAIAAIRASGATQEILVPGTDWTGGSTWTTGQNASVVGTGVVDPLNNYAFEIHEYLDAYASGTQSAVVSESIGVDRLKAVTAWAEQHGAKLFLGEFGVAQDATSLAAMKNMLSFMNAHSSVWQGTTYWGAGPWWGDYMYSIEPTKGVDKPQMVILDSFAPGGSAAGSSTTGSATNPSILLPSVTVMLAADTGISAVDAITRSAGLTGQADANATVKLSVDGGASTVAVTANAKGVWTADLTGLADGSHTVLVSETNAAGTGSASLSFKLDTEVPTPVIKTAGGVVGAASQTITGTGEAGSSVVLYDGGTALGQAIVVGADGKWSGGVTLTKAGATTITAQDTDTAGNVGISAGIVMTYDQAPVITSGGGGVTAVYNVKAGTQAVTTVSATPGAVGDTLTYALLDASGKATSKAAGFVIDAKSGALSFTGMSTSQGAHAVTAIAVSDHGTSAIQNITVNVGSSRAETALAGQTGVGQTFVLNGAGHLAVQGFVAAAASSTTPHSVMALSHALFNGASAGESGSALTNLIASHSVQHGADTLIVTDKRYLLSLANVDRKTLLSNAANFTMT